MTNEFGGIDWKQKVQSKIDSIDIELTAGRHVVSAGEATANTLNIDTGKPTATLFIVQIYRANVNVMADAAVSMAAGVLTVADGAVTYNMTAGDVVNWLIG